MSVCEFAFLIFLLLSFLSKNIFACRTLERKVIKPLVHAVDAFWPCVLALFLQLQYFVTSKFLSNLKLFQRYEIAFILIFFKNIQTWSFGWIPHFKSYVMQSLTQKNYCHPERCNIFCKAEIRTLVNL